ncbi:hypothetical protein EZV62_003901 [Acer yangbiense]|uniref:Uncharacterized protein n=1 Tax=Acer yangbiense TaxID=1000413 RepID=A0A5C7IKI5_9ROSI|nr:hypothetical protein EZV62_003901 [Acer yangbiense]
MASNNNMLQPQLPRFDGKNYSRWSQQMKVLYGSQDLWEVIENGFVELENQTGLTQQQANELKENCKKDKKALFFIYQAVDEVIFERISTATSAKAAWDALQLTYQDQRIVEKILRSMTRKFEHVVVAIEVSRDLSTLSVNSLMGSLQSHELRLKQFDTTPLEQAFQSHAYFNQSSRGRRGGRGGGRNSESRNNNNDSKEESIKIGDDKRLLVKGKGDILVQTKKGVKRISNVFYVPSLKHNLLSVGQLLQKGYNVIFKDDVCEIKGKDGGLIAKIKMTQNKMFPLNFSYGQSSCFNTMVKDPSWLWHLRYGHLSFNSLSHMCQNHMEKSWKWNATDQKQKSISIDIEDNKDAQVAEPDEAEPLSSSSSSSVSDEDSPLPTPRRSTRPHQLSKRKERRPAGEEEEEIDQQQKMKSMQTAEKERETGSSSGGPTTIDE